MMARGEPTASTGEVMMTPKRSPIVRLLMASAVLAVWTRPLAAQEAAWPTNGWLRASAADVGMDAAPLAELDAAIRTGRYGNIDRMVVVRNGRMVVSQRYENDYVTISRGHRGVLGCGTDACTGPQDLHEFNYFHPDFHPYFRGRDVHTLQSVTKSVTSALIGIAIGRGEIPGVDAKLLSFLGDYDLSGVDPRLHAATLDDLLTMRTGIEWHETDRPIDMTNTTFQLETSPDWVRFTLSQPMDAAPGEKWVYNSGGSHLMSAVIRKATGMTVDAYARAHLFGPLGIRDFHWKTTPTELPDTEGGLYLGAEDLARIGYLYLKDGVWAGRRVLPDGWVAASTSKRVERVNPAGWGYGYQWWRLDRGEVAIWAGLGFGGQYLIVIPERDLVGVINSWNVFGGSPASVLGPFLEALLASTPR